MKSIFLSSLFLYRPTKFIATFSERNLWTLLFFAILLLGCDSERQKEWKKWAIEVDKVSYRCGTIGNYEIKIKKTYLFYWPVYEGYNEWKSQPPPPLSCTAKLHMMPIEVYWPEMRPAGIRPMSVVLSDIGEPNYVSITITAAPNHKPWDLSMLLNYRLNVGDDPKLSYGDHIYTKIGLYKTEKPYRTQSLFIKHYYWDPGPKNTAKTFIECKLSDNGRVNYCRQIEYLAWLGAVLEIKYQRPLLKNWKAIAHDANQLIKNNSTYKGEQLWPTN